MFCRKGEGTCNLISVGGGVNFYLTGLYLGTTLQWNTILYHLIIIIILCIEMYAMNEFLGNIF